MISFTTLLTTLSRPPFGLEKACWAPQSNLSPQRVSRPALLGLVILVGTLFTLRLDAPFLNQQSEARLATVAHEMGQRGEWFTPQFQGRSIQKPPLVFWLMAGAEGLLGNTELAARVPSVIAGIAVVLITASLGARVYGAQAGVLAGVLLATMFQFAWRARKAQLDMPFTAFIMGAQMLLFRALHEQRGRLWAGGCACAALGAMVKGLAGVLLPLGTALAYALLLGRVRVFGRPSAWGAMTGTTAAVLVYYAALGPEFSTRFLMEDHIRRFLIGVDVVRPVWWYVPAFVVAILPYAGWLPFAVADWSFRSHRDACHLDRSNPGGRDPGTFLVCWFAIWFILISMSKGKQEVYLLPLLPPLAILMSAGVIQKGIRVPVWWARWAIAAVPASVSVGSAVFIGYLAHKAVLSPWPMATFGGLALAGTAAALGSFRWSTPRAVAAAVFTGILTSLAATTVGLPPLERVRTAPSMAVIRAIRETVGKASLVSYGRTEIPTGLVTFYLNLHLAEPLRRLGTRDELEDFLRADTTRFLLLSRHDWEGLEHSRPLGRPVVARVVGGPADYVILGPPVR